MGEKITKFTKIILDIMFVLGIIVTLSIPWSIKNIFEVFDMEPMHSYSSIIVALMASGVMAVLIIWELRKIFSSVINHNCFVNSNVISLKKMSVYSFVISVVMLVRCIFIKLTLAALSMVLVFVIAGLFSIVLAFVFDQAINYKEENDLTI